MTPTHYIPILGEALIFWAKPFRQCAICYATTRHSPITTQVGSSRTPHGASSRREIYEVNSVSLERIPENDITPDDTAVGYPVSIPDVPREKSTDVLAVRSDTNSSATTVPILPEHGPCLVDGTVTMDDKSYTTKVKIHAGPATCQYGCIAQLDSGSPATFINSNAVGTLKAMGAISDDCITNNTNRSWGGFGQAQPLQTTRKIRLSVQFLHNDAPSASLAVWAHIVPANTMEFPILMGRDSFMRFTVRNYRTLPPQPLDTRVMGELTLSSHDQGGAAAYVHDYSAAEDQFHLRYAGSNGMCLSHDQQMVEVNLVRADGTPALTGQYLVDINQDISPDDDLLVNEVMFVSNGRQFIPLAGALDLEPGDILGYASAPLLRVPVNSIRDLEPPAEDCTTTPGPLHGAGREDNSTQT